jgi:hypothetical protein
MEYNFEFYRFFGRRQRFEFKVSLDTSGIAAEAVNSLLHFSMHAVNKHACLKSLDHYFA